MNSARAFLSGIVDYAGLFPPASLDMRVALRAYSEYRAGSDGDLLGRFIVPASRLEEFALAAQDVLPADGEAWLISAIAGEDIESSHASILEFNSRRTNNLSRAGAICDMVEARVSSMTQVTAATDAFADSFRLFLEVPVDRDPRELVAAIGPAGAAAKIRTGGTVESAIPSSQEILAFMKACVDVDVPFKATAGLHHAVRGSYPLTYEPDSRRAIMHGYMNVFLASAFCASGSSDTALAVLEEMDPAAFRFDESGGWWRESLVAHSELERVRDTIALSFGSCSFTEPVGEARQLHLI